MAQKSKYTRICIVGAGAAGLSAAYYLKKQGYHNVTVLEKLDRVGGKCHSITYGYESCDLGAILVTPYYKCVKKMAKEVGAKLYNAEPVGIFDPTKSISDAPKFTSIFNAVTKETTTFKFLIGVFRFSWERFKLNSILSTPGFQGISQYPELTQSFAQWLNDKKLSYLSSLFKVMITNLGYGNLDDIPAAYALKYMNLQSFWALFNHGSDIPNFMSKKFTEGYQRFWERISWNLNVDLNVSILEINRSEKIKVHLKKNNFNTDKVSSQEKTLEFDELILSCPLDKTKLSQFLQLSDRELFLLDQIIYNPYSVATYEIKQLHGLHLPKPITYILPTPPNGSPMAIVKNVTEGKLISFYTTTVDEAGGEIPKDRIIQEIHRYVGKLGATIEGEPYIYKNWCYFPHVSSEVMQSGFYDQLEELQGIQNTYYTGGVMNFEIVESVVEYSKALVEKHFPPVT